MIISNLSANVFQAFTTETTVITEKTFKKLCGLRVLCGSCFWVRSSLQPWRALRFNLDLFVAKRDKFPQGSMRRRTMLPVLAFRSK